MEMPYNLFLTAQTAGLMRPDPKWAGGDSAFLLGLRDDERLLCMEAG
jgi:hypothetical protein